MNQKQIELFEQKSPIKKISKLHRLNLAQLAGFIGDIGMARGTLPFLMEVLCCEGIIQQDITRTLFIDKAATARGLQKLEDQGFVTRREDKDNRRQKRVFATEKTKGLRDDIIKILTNHKQQLFHGFSKEEENQFLAMLDRMIVNMGGE